MRKEKVTGLGDLSGLDAPIVTGKQGSPKPDSKLRDTEKIALKDDIEAYFDREVLPHVSDAWMDRGKDKVGYKISFTKYFYEYQPLRSLDEIKADILALEAETDGLLREIHGDGKEGASHFQSATHLGDS